MALKDTREGRRIARMFERHEDSLARLRAAMAATRHTLETITPTATVEGVPLILDCSCGAEIMCADDADAVDAAFAGHVPGEWVVCRDNPHNLTGSWLRKAEA